MVTKPGDIRYSLSTRFGGRGLGGEWGRTATGNCLTGQCWDLGGFEGFHGKACGYKS